MTELRMHGTQNTGMKITMKATNPILVLACLFTCACGKTDTVNVDGFTGATPLALAQGVPSGISLAVNGEVNREYRLDSAQLSRLATTRIRTREITRDGEFLGAYAYVGIPVIHILEGVKPQKENADFDRPLDMIVTFTDSGGKITHFSYNEICMVDDAFPITLAYYREPVLPSKNPEIYKENKFKESVKGLRLICPADTDVERYLDDVQTLTLRTPPVGFDGLPAMQKGTPCSSDSLVRCANGECSPAILEGIEEANVRNWIRIGHGMGYKAVVHEANGYSLTSFLEGNFPSDRDGSFYLFIACDGYRSLFSGTEIFETAAGSESMIITEMDGERPSGGLTLGPVRDYFVDRNVWGLSHIVQLTP
jgi:hypothetical protein